MRKTSQGHIGIPNMVACRNEGREGGSRKEDYTEEGERREGEGEGEGEEGIYTERREGEGGKRGRRERGGEGEGGRRERKD